MTNLKRDEDGLAMLESPFAIIVLLAIGLGAFWIANIVHKHHQLEEAASAGTRYASRALYAANGGSERRRNADEIRNFVVEAAKPLELGHGDIQINCGPTPASLAPCPNPERQRPGTYIEVRANTTVAETDPVMAIARSVNGVLGVLRLPAPFPPSITASEASVAAVE